MKDTQRKGFGWRAPILVALCAVVGLLGGCDAELAGPPPPPVDPPVPVPVPVAVPVPAPAPTYVPCANTQIRVSWHLLEDGVDVECLPEDTVSVRVDNNRMIADFPCSDGESVTPPVQGGVVHNISFVLSDGDGNVLSQTADMGLGVACGGVTVAPEVEFPL